MFNAFSISGILIVTTCAVMALVLLLQPWKKFNSIWGIFCLTVMMWGLGAYNISTANNPASAVLWWKVAYIGVILIPVIFTHFVFIFLEKKNKFFIYALYLVATFYLYENIFTQNFITGVHYMFDQMYYLSPSFLYTTFLVFFVLLVVYSHFLLYQEYKVSEGNKRRQIQYFFLGSFIGFLGGSFSFLPVYDVEIYPYLNNAVFLFPLIMGYAIFKYNLMDIRVVAAEIFIVTLWVFVFVRAILAPFGSTEQIADLILLVATVVIGILLIKSVLEEIRAREQIELLAKDLGIANERLKILDQQKSEFVSIASHQLRSPLTAIKGYTSMLLEGSFGEIPPKAREAIDRVSQSSLHLVALVEDLLSISRIEQGRMVYDFVQVDLCKMIKDIMGALMPNVRKNNLELTFHADNNESCMIYADYEKIRQVILNIIDNAIKYTPKGFVRIKIHKDKERKRVVLSVKDSGIGVTEELKSRLFEKFSRGDGGARLHVNSTGLGLYVAKEIMKAHKGDIWVESPGEGKGSTFYVEFLSAEATEENSHNDEVADFAGKL